MHPKSMLTCIVCTKSFHRAPSQVQKYGGRYCSTACKGVAQARGEWKSCPVCKARFYVTQANERRGQGTYCSVACGHVPLTNKLTRPCDRCGKEFTTRPDKAARGEGRYCSRACADRGRKKDAWRLCEHCGGRFLVTAARARGAARRGAIAHYCSRRCMGLAARQRSLNDPLRFGPTYREWRRAVYQRDGYVCQHCTGPRGGDLIAHHIKSWTQFPALRFDVGNGVTLCRPCHARAHHDEMGNFSS